MAALLFGSSPAFVGPASPGLRTESRASLSMEISTKAGMETLAKELNPVIGFWGKPRSRRAAP
jgi:hypothetical protein